MANCGINFFDRHPSFFICKSAMNAPRMCKLCNGVNKSLNFFIFQLSKAGQRPLHTCQMQKGGVFEV